MIKSFLIRILTKLYLSEMREITKVPVEEEPKLYTFMNPDDTLRLLKGVMTAQTLWHFEAKNEEERLMAKGAAAILKIIVNAHLHAREIYDDANPIQTIEDWKRYRKTKRTN